MIFPIYICVNNLQGGQCRWRDQIDSWIVGNDAIYVVYVFYIDCNVLIHWWDHKMSLTPPYVVIKTAMISMRWIIGTYEWNSRAYLSELYSSWSGKCNHYSNPNFDHINDMMCMLATSCSSTRWQTHQSQNLLVIACGITSYHKNPNLTK